ncbi:MAG: universal stress protein [Gammaproteobacteria bacterium]|nr:universal stress protein [Gammaproteobacteria bacterium]
MTAVKVLVALHPQHPDRRVMEKLQRFAEQQKLAVTLYMCDYRSSIASRLMLQPESLEQAINHINSQHLKALEALAAEFAHPNIDYQCETAWHKPYYEALIAKAEAMEAHWVIKMATPREGLRKWLFTSSDYQLLKTCAQPLLLTKGQSWAKDACVVAAVDPSHNDSQPSGLDKAVVKHAKAVAERLQLPLKVCHVFDPIGWEVVLNSTASAGVMGQFVVLDTPEDHQQMLQNLREEHQKNLSQLQKNHGLKDNEVVQLEGDPVDALLQFCNEQQAALLVVGTHYRSGLLGSTAEALFDSAECDLVAVKPAQFTALDTH